MTMKRVLILLAAVAFFAAPRISAACVGKSLVIGGVNSPNVVTITEMLNILITERTGTTVVIKYFDDYKSLGEAAKKGEVDIMVDFTGRCYVDVMNQLPETSKDKVFAAVKEAYQRDLNLIWLEPFGFSDQSVVSQKAGATPAVAAPVVRKDTLVKFPALPRVINKLAGKVDNSQITRLTDESQGGKVKKVTRKYLKDNKLI